MEYVRIGIIAKPQGIRGELKINSLSDTLHRFLELKYVFVEEKGTYTRYEVKGTRIGDQCAYLFLEHVYSRNEAELLRGRYLCVDRKNAITLPEGRYFIFDLMGCEVVTDDGRRLGEVTEVMQPGANDVYVVKGNGTETLIPAVRDFLLDVNVAEKRIVVRGKMLEEVVLDED